MKHSMLKYYLERLKKSCSRSERGFLGFGEALAKEQVQKNPVTEPKRSQNPKRPPSLLPKPKGYNFFENALWTVAAAFALVFCAHSQPGPGNPPTSGGASTVPTAGRALYLKNCSHCHAADARGDEGPDLHNLDWSDTQITNRILKGKKGQMTAFEGKLTAEQIKTVTEYVKGLK